MTQSLKQVPYLWCFLCSELASTTVSWHWDRSTTSHPSASAVRWQKSFQGLFISYVYAGYSADFLFLYPPDPLPVCSYLSVPLFFFSVSVSGYLCVCPPLACSLCLSTACLFSVSVHRLPVLCVLCRSLSFPLLNLSVFLSCFLSAPWVHLFVLVCPFDFLLARELALFISSSAREFPPLREIMRPWATLVNERFARDLVPIMSTRPQQVSLWLVSNLPAAPILRVC